MSIEFMYFTAVMAVTDPIHLTAVLGSVTPPGRLRRAVYLGAERHLRDAPAVFGAHPLPTAVYLNGRDFPEGQPAERAEHALDAVIGSAVSLAGALRERPALGPMPLAAGF